MAQLARENNHLLGPNSRQTRTSVILSQNIMQSVNGLERNIILLLIGALFQRTAASEVQARWNFRGKVAWALGKTVS